MRQCFPKPLGKSLKLHDSRTPLGSAWGHLSLDNLEITSQSSACPATGGINQWYKHDCRYGTDQERTRCLVCPQEGACPPAASCGESARQGQDQANLAEA